MSDQDLLRELRLSAAERDEGGGGARRWLAAGAVLVVLALVAGAWLWWSAGRALPVTTATASAPAQAGGAAVLQATGYVTARRQATVSAQIVGTLTEVLIEEGDAVQAGQVLARLEDSSQQAMLASAKANAGAAAAQAHQLEVQLEQARREARRQDDLVQRGLVSDQVAEQARTAAAALAAQLRAARAQHAAAEAQVDVAQVNFDYTVVRAPFAGVVTQKAAQVGEIIAPAAAGGGFTRTGVGTIVDMDSLEVDVDVNEAYIGRVTAHMGAEAVLDAYPDWRIPAHVVAIVPAADRGKATVKVRVALDERDARIVPDMGVRVSFLEGEGEADAAALEGVLVPAAALVERGGRSVVFIVREGVAREREVEPAAQRYGDLRLLPEGVAAGTQVILRPPATLQDGARVNPGGAPATK